ncbi:MAG: DUF255 domain-containing protein [Bacteroidetes bacterium]|nr:DUF255 domain-containing protein [Bacteroidota bacterium]
MRNSIRQFILILAIISLPGIIFSQENTGKKGIVQWYSFADAYKLNKKKPKKMIVDVYTDWCGWCKKMDKETFQDPETAKYMQKHFYCVKLDAETKDTIVIDSVKFVNKNLKARGGNNQLAVELLRGKMTYPSYVFINEKNQVLTVVPGYMNVADFAPVLHYFGENAFKDIKWEDYRASYNKTDLKK